MGKDITPNKKTTPGRYATSSECARCELCLNLLPGVFAIDEEGRSFVQHQPLTNEEHEKLHEALENCPISGIVDYCPLGSVPKKEET
ncbi:ferredoxin [bacterium]|jgi:ferredoxin|nr:ferredoxin [bacterium]